MNQNESTISTETDEVSLVNFPFHSQDSLSALAGKLELSMGGFGLRLCQNFFRMQKRDPRVEELRLLDGIAKDAYCRPDTLLLSEMTTESQVIADTFADLMTRRTRSQRAETKPLSLAALSGLMESWLTLHDPREPSAPDICVHFTPYRDLLLAADGYRRTASSGNEETDISIGIRTSKSADEKPPLKEGDYVYAVLSSKENDEPFLRTLAELLTSPAANNIKTIKVAQGQSLLSLLVDVGRGMTVDPQKIAQDGEKTLSVLTRPVFGSVFVASPERSADLLLEAQEAGLCVRRLARIVNGNTVCIVADGSVMAFPLEFLRSLTFSRLCSATVDQPSRGAIELSLSRIGACTISGKRNAVVKVDSSGSSPFRAALLSVIYALSHCVAAGADVVNATLASRLSLPHAHMGESLSAILGLYRAQAEFALRGNAPRLMVCKEAQVSVSAVTMAPLPDTIVSDRASGNGTGIFYLDPLYTSDGIPDFADLKKLYGYIGALIADGKVLSIRPTGESLLTDLEEMSRDIVVEYIPDAPVPSHIGGFLVETNDNIEGILIAKTENPDKCEGDS